MYQVQDQFFIVRNNGDHILQPVGKLLTDAQFKQLNPIKQGKCSKVARKKSLMETYEMAEVAVVLEGYVKYSDPTNQSDNRNMIIDDYRECFDTHTDDSLQQLINGLKGIDNRYPASGLVVSKHVKQLAEQLYPEIFG